MSTIQWYVLSNYNSIYWYLYLIWKTQEEDINQSKINLTSNALMCSSNVKKKKKEIDIENKKLW